MSNVATKAQVAQLAAAQGLQTAYSGRKRRMYLIGKGARRVCTELRAQFPDLPFTLGDQATH